MKTASSAFAVFAGTAGRRIAGLSGLRAKMNPRSFRETIGGFSCLLFILATVIRLAYTLPLPPDRLSPDAADWINTSLAVLGGEGIGNSIRPPGYVFFLAALFSIFGKSVAAVRAAQSVLGALTCVLAYKIGRKTFSELTGRISGILVCFYPYLIAYAGDVLCETFLAFMLALAVYQVIRTAEAPGWRNYALTGVLMGITGLTKSVTLPFFLLAGLWLWRRTGKFRAAAVTGLFTLLSIAPWTLRNHLHYGGGYVMPVNSPWYMAYCSYSDRASLYETIGDRLKKPGEVWNARFLPDDEPYAAGLPAPERDKYCREKAIGWIKSNPSRTAWLIYKRLLHFWRLYPMVALKQEKISAMATSGLYIPLALAGIFLSRSMLARTSLFLALFASYTAVNILFVTGIRYRVPIDVFVIIFAAYALERIYGMYGAKRSGH